MENEGRHLFILDQSVWRSMNISDVVSTSEALKELDLYKPPYESFDIKSAMSTDDYAEFTKQYDGERCEGDDKPFLETYRYNVNFSTNPPKYTFKFDLHGDKVFLTLNDIAVTGKLLNIASNEEIEEMINHLRDSSLLCLAVLIVLLSTKNCEKTTEKIKRYGPKSKKRPREYAYITRIKVGKITETCRSDNSSGTTVRAHLRRGHIRTQHFGIGNKEIKKIFIHPVFVNADEGWIANQRKAYVVKAA